MSTKLYIGNMNCNTSYFELENLFCKYGEIVYIDIVNDLKSLKSKGFGFIEMADRFCAKNAMEAINKTVLMKKRINVSLAKEVEIKPTVSNIPFYLL